MDARSSLIVEDPSIKWLYSCTWIHIVSSCRDYTARRRSPTQPCHCLTRVSYARANKSYAKFGFLTIDEWANQSDVVLFHVCSNISQIKSIIRLYPLERVRRLPIPIEFLLQHSWFGINFFTFVLFYNRIIFQRWENIKESELICRTSRPNLCVKIFLSWL